MRKYFAIAPVMAAILAGCAHVDTAKYESAYYEKTSKQPAASGTVAAAPAGQTIKAKAGDISAPSAVTVTPAMVTRVTGTAKITGKPAEKKKKFRVKELVVNSDTMTYNKDTAEAVFSGNMEAEAENVKIYADKLKSKNYRDSATASGNVRAFYKEYNISIECDTFDYASRLSQISAQSNVNARKVLDNGNTITMRADVIDFDADNDIMTAKKGIGRVRVTMQDIMAFADQVVYNNATRQMEMKGHPFLKKGKSLFFSDNITLDVDKKTIKMKESIWTKLFYRDFEKEGKVAGIADKNKSPR